MKFEFPSALVFAALIVPLGMGGYLWVGRRRMRQLAAIVAPRLWTQLTVSVNPVRRRVKAVLFGMAFIALLFALARPQAGFRFKEVERTSVDFLIALDLSGSMLAEDAVPVAGHNTSRLTAAKTSIANFLDSLGEDRVGLIAFAGEAHVVAPVTQDHEAVKRNLAALDTTSLAKQGTDLAEAIKLAEKTFASGDFESKAVVFVTDGEELQGDAVVAARAAASRGMSVFTIGVGSTIGAKIPRQERPSDPMRFAKNEFGREVTTRLNERVMQQVAANGRGFYEPLGPKGEGLRHIYDRGLQPLGHGTRTKPSKDLIEHFQWPLGLAIALFLAECLINERRKAPVLNPT